MKKTDPAPFLVPAGYEIEQSEPGLQPPITVNRRIRGDLSIDRVGVIRTLQLFVIAMPFSACYDSFVNIELTINQSAVAACPCCCICMQGKRPIA